MERDYAPQTGDVVQYSQGTVRWQITGMTGDEIELTPLMPTSRRKRKWVGKSELLRMVLVRRDPDSLATKRK